MINEDNKILVYIHYPALGNARGSLNVTICIKSRGASIFKALEENGNLAHFAREQL